MQAVRRPFVFVLPFSILCFFFSFVSSLSSDFVDDPNLCLRLTSAGPDEIHALPGLNYEPNFKHYSGFLKTSSKNLFHYWFVSSQNKPCQDPLLFWFNGGPGCSSLAGLLDEMGPFLVNADGKTLRQNANAWNKNASIVYIESPVGVGFSYSVDGVPEASNDDSTAAQNYEAIKQFFNKFPLFRANPTFITGESYAGIYVPMLVAKIVDGQAQFPVNLEGMAIGNGYMNTPLDTDTLARFAYAHGLVEEKQWQNIGKECCNGCFDTCDLGSLYGSCREKVADITHFCWRGGLNVYDIYENCTPHPTKLAVMRRGIFMTKSIYANDSLLWQSDSAKFEENSNNDQMQHLLRCVDGRPVFEYLNIPQVRKALHIPTSVIAWDQCSDWVSRHYRNQYSDMSHFVWKALWAKVRVLLFYGDTDMACNFLLGQRFSALLGLKRLEEKKPWHFDGQIAGFKTAYANELTFITVRGAGHMVPQRRPREIAYALEQFWMNRTI